MSGRFVRASKYRHVFGRTTKKEQCYDNLRISKNAWDTNLVKANPEYLSVNWEAGGGGALAVIPLNETGKLPERIPLFRGHTAAVLDTDWNPFDDRFLASGSDDAKVALYRVPENFSLRTEKPEDIVDVEPIAKLSGHTRKVGHVLFNPAAANVLASASGDYTIKLWDLEASSPKLTLKHTDTIQSLSWSADGSQLVTTCRDKKLRVWDTRQEKPAIETPGHSGAKNSRAVWMGEHDRIATTGFSKMSDRQLGLWDARAAREPIEGFQILDQISGVCMPFWDEGSQILYLAGKGDGNIRYYEYQNDKFEYLSQHTSPEPQRGIAFMPKRGVNTHDNEITRAFKTVNDSLVEPISFIVPRRAEVFQGDIYPPTTGLKPAMGANDWFAGKPGALPPKIDLESLYDGTTAREVPSDIKPPAAPAAPAVAASKTPAPAAAEPITAPAAPASAISQRGPPPSAKETQSSIANMASKFADDKDTSGVNADDEDDDASSFEDIAPPASRPAAAAVKPPPAANSFKPPAAPAAAAVPSSSSSSPSVSTPRAAPTTTTTAATTPGAALGAASSSGAAPSSGDGAVSTSLAEIKALLEAQSAALASQNARIGDLTREVETLKVRGGSASAGGSASQEKDERIRQLELELEEARS